MKKLVLVVVLLAAMASPARGSVSLFVYPGGTPWSDVVILPEGPALIRSNDAAVILQTPARVVWATALPESVLYLNAAYCRGEVRAVAQGHDTGQALEVRQSGVRAFGPSFGQNSTQIACVNGRFLAYTQFSPTQYSVSDLDTMTTEILTMAHTSQGFRDVLSPSGEVRRGDDWFRLPNQYGLGRSIHQPVERAGVFAGQNSDGPGILALLADRAFTVVPGEAFEPALERFDGGFAVAARTPAGAALAIVTPPYPPHEPPRPIITPIAEVCGNGIDDNGNGLIDEGCPIDPPQLGKLPDAVFATLKAERARFPTDRPLTEAEICVVLNATARIHRAGGAGLERKGSNGCPQPVTGITVWRGLRVGNVGYDVCGACSIGRFDPVQAEGGAADSCTDARPGCFLPPADVPTDPDPDPDPALEARVSSLEQSVATLRADAQLTAAKVNGLEAALHELAARVVLLEEKPSGGLTADQVTQLAALREFLDALARGFSTSRSLGHAHGVRLELVR